MNDFEVIIMNNFTYKSVSGIVTLILGSGILALFLVGSAQAACNNNERSCSGEPALFSVAIKQIALCTDKNCTIKFSLGTSETRFDLAAIGVGQSAGTYAAGDLTIKPGTYSYFYLKVNTFL